MTAGNLIKMLQTVDPSQEVEFSIGGALDDSYRRKCAKVELRGGECLNYLCANGAVIYCDGGTPFLTITLEQINWPSDGFKKQVEKYDQEHKETGV